MWSLIRTDKSTLLLLVTIAIPMVISQSAYAVMIFTDRYFMSLIGPTHIAATLGGGVAAFMCLSLFVGMLSYGNALVAQYLGAGQPHLCSRVLMQGVWLALFSTPLLLLIGYGVYHGFTALDHDPLQTRLEQQYFAVLLAGGLLTLLKACFSSYFAGLGRTPVVMATDILAVGLNVPLSYALIFGVWGLPELGLVGAALGTVLSNLLALLVQLGFYLAPRHRRRFRVAESLCWDRVLIARYWRQGLPSGVEMFLNIAAFNAFILLFQTYGVSEGAAAAIVLNWDLMSFVPMVGLHIAMISLVGRFVGAGDQKRLNSVISAGFVLGLSWSALLALLFVIFRDSLVGVFMTPAMTGAGIEVLATWMMLGMASYVMADAVMLIAGGVLRGAGDTRWLMLASTLLHWLMVVLQYLLIVVLELSPRLSWMVFVATSMVLALCFTLRLMGPGWRRQVARQWAASQQGSA